jgi:hypothetical protein
VVGAGRALFVAVPNAYAASRQIAVAMGLISHPTAVTVAKRCTGTGNLCMETLQSDIAAAGLQISTSAASCSSAGELSVRPRAEGRDRRR